MVSEPKSDDGGVFYHIIYTIPNEEATVDVRYQISTNGTLSVDYKYTPNKSNLPNIPRLGMYMTLPMSYTDVSWYENGHEESYWDRKSGQKVGLYSGEIID